MERTEVEGMVGEKEEGKEEAREGGREKEKEEEGGREGRDGGGKRTRGSHLYVAC